MGNRIAKHVYNNQTGMLEKSTYYILDAQGNQLSMYDQTVNPNAVSYYLSERNIYGSKRIGMINDTVNMYNPEILPSYGILGNRKYELSNHLGNVLTVINDALYPKSEDSANVDSYVVGISNTFDYSPFGVMLDGRSMENSIYSPANNTNSQTPVDTVEIYKNEFDTPPATSSPYTGATTTLDANLSNTQWTSSTNDFTNYNSTGSGSVKSIAVKNASSDTTYLTLTMDVASGYNLDITSYSFAHRSSATGYNSYKLVVNGTEIGTGSIYVTSSGSTLHSTGLVNVTNAITDQTGTVNVVLKLYGGMHGSWGTFRMDNFVLNGFTQAENASSGSDQHYVVSNGYRYGFNGMEKDNAVKGRGNSYNYKKRMFDPRVGRFLSIDPKASSFPYYSTYQFAGNKPTIAIDLDGAEELIKTGANGSKEINTKDFKPALTLHLSADIKVTVWENANGVLAMTRADRNIVNSFMPTFKAEPSNPSSTGVQVVGNQTVFAGIYLGGVPYTDENGYHAFDFVKIQGPASVGRTNFVYPKTPILASGGPTSYPNRHRNRASNNRASNNAVYLDRRVINKTINTILKGNGNKIKSISLSFNSGLLSNQALKKLNSYKQSLKAKYPNAKIEFNDSSSTYAISNVKIGYTNPQSKQSTIEDQENKSTQ